MAKDDRPRLRFAAEGICKAFAAPVLDHVDLAVEVGSIHGLVGENGAGKSTLAKIIVGLERPDAGTLRLDGDAYRPGDAADSLRAGVAICTQELSLVDDLSIAENLLLRTRGTLRHAIVRRRAAHANAARLLDLVGLGGADPDASVGSLSLAEKQLVEIAKALAAPARLLVLDEPTSALTGPQAETVHRLLRAQAASGVAVIYISHRLGDVLALCDQVSVLRDGRMQSTQPAAALDEKTLIRQMAGVDADFAANPRQDPSDARPVHLCVDNLRTRALPHPIRFRLQRGEILGIAGLAGAGRTELLGAVFGLERRLSGSVVLQAATTGPIEIRNARHAVKSGIGLVPEDRAKDGVFRDLALAFNVTIAGLGRIADRIGRLVRALESDAVTRLIDELRIKASGTDQLARELSGGNQQKSLLGRWLHCDAELLLLDEPTRGVDVAAKLAIHETLAALRDTGTSVVIASSELDELQRLCDRILVLSNRKVAGEFRRDDWDRERLLEAAFSGHAS